RAEPGRRRRPPARRPNRDARQQARPHLPAAVPVADKVVSAMPRVRSNMRDGLAALALAAALAAPPAAPEVRIRASPGGEVGPYLKLFTLLRQSGERIVIDGPCFSACTLVLSTIPRDRICVTSRAVLGFHAPRWVDRQGRVYAATK